MPFLTGKQATPGGIREKAKHRIIAFSQRWQICMHCQPIDWGRSDLAMDITRGLLKGNKVHFLIWAWPFLSSIRLTKQTTMFMSHIWVLRLTCHNVMRDFPDKTNFRCRLRVAVRIWQTVGEIWLFADVWVDYLVSLRCPANGHVHRTTPW